MTLKEARALQAEIHQWGYHCTVPLGWGPNGYWCQIINNHGPVRLRSRVEARKYRAFALRRDRKALRNLSAPPKRRTPLEIMIDRACGLP